MNVIDAIMTRRSIRKYTGQAISPEDLRTILEAGMAGPTANNTQNWRFLVIDDQEILADLPKYSPYMGMAAKAPLAILVCSDVSEIKNGYWQQDCAAAIENMMLAARGLEIGSCWCGVHPVLEREVGLSQKFGLPEVIKPLGLVVFGHPDQPFSRENRFDPAKVKYNHWNFNFPGGK